MPSKSILIAIAIFHCQCTPFLVKGEKKIFHAKESYPPDFLFHSESPLSVCCMFVDSYCVALTQ